MRNILIAVIAILAMNLVLAGEPVGTVADNGQTITLPVVHDTTMRSVADLSAAELAFIESVPAGGGLRAAVQEMLLAGVVHVPVGGKYVAGESVRYWSMYQSWTGPAKVTVPLIQGPKGDKGDTVVGPPGPPGPPGEDGKDAGTPEVKVTVNLPSAPPPPAQPITVNNITFVRDFIPGYMLNAAQAGSVVFTQFAGLSFVPRAETKITVTATATATQTQWQQQHQQQQQQQYQAVQIDP